MERLTAGLSLALLLAPGLAAGMRTVAPGELSVALAEATTGDVLELLPGVHPGPVTVSRAITLRGRPGAEIRGSGEGTVLTVVTSDVTVEDLKIGGGGRDLSKDEAVLLLKECRGVTVKGCELRARAFGIYLRAGGGHEILGNEVVGDSSLPSAQRGNGIHLWHTTGNLVARNRISDARDGVYLSFAHENRILENSGREMRYGIHYMYSERNHLEGNHFSRCTGGFALMYSRRNRIVANRTDENRDFGILCLQLERSVLERNRSRRNGRGFFLENSATNRFVENDLGENGVGAYLTAGSEANVFTKNRFAENLVQVYRDRRSENRWHDECRGNHWSDYLGVDWSGDGVGEHPYRLSTSASSLMAHRPAARWFWMSPSFLLLDWWDRLSRPRAEAAHDPYPLVGPRGDG